METALTTHCPVCDSDAGPPLLQWHSVPAALNYPYPTLAAARLAPSGTLQFAFCAACQFGFNAAFDPTLIQYDEGYENSQTHSAAFRAHLDRVAHTALAARDNSTGPIVEVGCGQGDFLFRLQSLLPDRPPLVGMDPSCRATSSGSVRLIGSTFESLPPNTLPAKPSLVYSRHVIEHIPHPVAFLRAVADRGLTPLLLETPSLEWIVRHEAFFDLVYEHCNYFTAHSLRTILARAGFVATAIESAFEDQYFLVHAAAGKAIVAHPDNYLPPDAIRRLADGPTLWKRQLAELAAQAPIALWGAGAKGVSFANLLDPDRHSVACLIDVNPAKQNRFIPVSGHPILSPEAASQSGVATALVMNPNYLAEIRDLAATLPNPLSIQLIQT